MEIEDVLERLRSAAVGAWWWTRTHVVTDDRLSWTRRFLGDLATAAVRTVTDVRMPDRASVRTFATGRLLGTVAAWSAALMSAGLVDRFFARRSIGNLWGVAASRDKVLLSPEQHELVGDVVGFVFGLVTLIVVRWFVLGTLEELRAIRGSGSEGS